MTVRRHLLSAVAALPLLVLPTPGLSDVPHGVSVQLSQADLLAATRSFRDRKLFERAAQFARTGMARFADDPVWPLLLSLILTDQGQTELAAAILAAPAAQKAPEKERLLAQAYIERRAGRSFDALRLYYAVLDRDPANDEARGEATAILRELRAPWAAARIAARPPSLALAGDMAAAQVRWGSEDSDDPLHRFDATDRAIASLDRLIPEAQTANDAALVTRLRMDRIVALRDRVRMAEVIAEAEALQNAGMPLPAYVRQAQADALLHLRQPEAARAAYEAVLRESPDNRAARIGLVYAAVEMEDFATAYALADDILAKQPVWQRFRNDATLYPDEAYVDALLLAAAVRHFGGQSRDAWDRIAPERDAAPANPFIRSFAASLMKSRNWPRAAHQEYQIALGMAPALLEARIGLAESRLGRNLVGEAREDIALLAAQYPENTTVKRLETDLAAATGWEVEAEFRPSHESGGGTFGNSGNELKTSLVVLSPLIGDRWRLSAGHGYDNSHPPEGFVDLKRFTAGVRLDLPDFDAGLAVTRNVSKISRTGLAGTADWSPTDHLSFAVAGELASAETPLRALLNGISADSAAARFTYAWDEARHASFGLGWMPFSDGNQRVTLNARYEKKFAAAPHFGLTVRGELYGSTNSGAGAPYYNPSADGSASIDVRAEHIVWRRYENSFVQALTLNGGWYGQQGFRGGAIGTATYEHRWRFDPWTELVYGASWGRRLYDGEHARETGFFVTLRKKV